jgi:hypothetical protein
MKSPEQSPDVRRSPEKFGVPAHQEQFPKDNRSKEQKLGSAAVKGAMKKK